MRTVRMVAGACCWVAALSWCGWWLWGQGPKSALPLQTQRELWAYATGHRHVVELQFDDDCAAWIGDPIFVIDDGRPARPVGKLAAVWLSGTKICGRAVFYSSAPALDTRASLTCFENPDSIQWVLQTMLTEDKLRQIRAELQTAFEQNRAEFVRLLRPVAEAALKDILRVVEEDLPPAVERRRAQWQQLADHHQRDVVERELLPLLRAQVWPIVQRHAEPLVQEIGRELWQRASLFRFGWRYLYDRSPLPEKNLAQKEWARFLAEDVTPVLERHQADFLAVQQKIVADVAQDAEVQEHVRVAVARLADDPDVRRLVAEVADEVVLKNPRLQGVLEKHLRGPLAQEALRWSAERLEPTAVRIGELLLGNAEQGITPEFAHVVRSQILQKDRRWLVLDVRACQPPAPTAPTTVLQVRRGAATPFNPFLPAAPGGN